MEEENIFNVIDFHDQPVDSIYLKLEDVSNVVFCICVSLYSNELDKYLAVNMEFSGVTHLSLDLIQFEKFPAYSVMTINTFLENGDRAIKFILGYTGMGSYPNCEIYLKYRIFKYGEMLDGARNNMS